MAKKTQAPKQTRRPDHTRRSRAVVFSGLAALAAVALGLTAFAVLSQRGDASSTEVSPAPTFATPKPEPEPTPEPEPEPQPVALEAPQRILSAGEEPGLLLRAALEPCGAGDSTVEVSFDDGATWEQSVVTDLAGAAIRQLDAHDSTITRATFLDTACQPASARSFTGGTAWEPDETAAVWALNNDEPAVAWTPQGALPLPCTAVSLIGEASRAVALCADASVTTTEDAGSTWSQPLAVSGASAVGVTPTGYLIASFQNDAECVGLRTVMLASGQLSPGGGCLAGQFPPASVAVAANASAQYVWAGEQLFRSFDLGASWS